MIMQKLLDWFRNQFVFSKTVIFIWGLVLSHSVVEYAVVNLLIDYLGGLSLRGLSLRKSAVVVNLIDGGSAVFVVIVTHISDAYTGSFNTIVLCTSPYVMGLMLLWVSDLSPSEFNVFYVAVVLIALGKAGKDPLLQSFLEFQLREKVKQSTEALNGDNEEGEDRIDISTEVWWRTAWISGAAIAIFVLGNPTWRQTFITCALIMGGNYLLFLFGFFYYHYETPTGSPLTRIYRVLKAALLKLNFEYPDSAEKYYWKDKRPNYLYSKKAGELHLLPHAPLFRFLDKAAIIREVSNVSPERQEEKGELCTVTQVREVKRLIPIAYLGFSFFAYSLVAASGNTYFVEQASNLNPQIGSFIISVSFLFVLKSLARDVIRFSFWWFELTQQRITTWRIGAGMFCAVLCCITAWQVELHRLSLIKREGVQDTETIVSLSILVLIPQYFLLGLMEGLAENGLGEFFYNYVPKSLRKFGQPFSEMVLSIGKFLSIPCVLIFGRWFKETINTSRLDKYFLMLAILSFVSLCIYLYYSYSSMHIFMEKYPEDEQFVPMEQTLEPIHDAAQEELGSLLASSMIEEEIDTAGVDQSCRQGNSTREFGQQ